MWTKFRFLRTCRWVGKKQKDTDTVPPLETYYVLTRFHAGADLGFSRWGRFFKKLLKFLSTFFWEKAKNNFFPPLQFFTFKFIDDIVPLLWKFTYRLIRPRQTYLVFILNLVKPLVTLIYWSSCEVGGGGGKKEPKAEIGYLKIVQNGNLRVDSSQIPEGRRHSPPLNPLLFSVMRSFS